ncbi:MAG: transglycosylase domain-containing protein, partial [Oceanidesulfovibrio sp.]
MRNTYRLLFFACSALCCTSFAAFLVLNALFPFPEKALHEEPAIMVRASDGTPLRIFLPQHGRRRFLLELEDISPVFQRVLLASEDRFFHYHPGVNPFSILRATYQNFQEGDVVSGGSTITMQLARLAEPKARSLKAKAIEAFRAFQLEFTLSKDEIFKLYMNNIPYGGNVVGVGAAAYSYFGKSAGALSLGEATLLAVLPRAPRGYDPIAHPQAARNARDRLLDALAQRGVFPPEEVVMAKKQPLPAALTASPMLAPHGARMAYEQLKEAELTRLPKLHAKRTWELKTTIDMAAQRQSLATVRRRLPGLRLAGLENAAVVVLDR